MAACGGEGEPLVPGVGAGGSASSLPGATVFADDQVLEVRLTLAPELVTELEEHGNREEYVPGAARLVSSGQPAVELASIGVRHKGAWTLHHCWDDFGGARSYAAECAKLSFKLKLDHYAADARFDGLKRINLHAASGEASKLRELVAYRAYRDFGVVAPRAIPARLYVNDEPLGLFVAVEDVDGRFTTAHFPDGPDGNLYKEIWPNAATSDAEFLAALETNKEAGDVSGLRAFAEAVTQSTPQTFDSELLPFVDVESLLRYIAVDRALRNWDGIMAFYLPRTPHNFYWYRESGADPRFHLIPWDLDNTLWAFDPYMAPQAWVTAPPLPDFNSRPYDCDPRSVWEVGGPVRVMPPRCDRLLDGLAEQHWSRLVELGQELIAGPLAPERLEALVNALEARLAPIVADDPGLDSDEWRSGVDELRGIVSLLGTSFEAFLDAGLIEEVRNSSLDEPTPELVNAPTTDSGLHVGAITNFEFGAPPLSPEPNGVYTYGDPLASFSAALGTESPLSGGADLRFDFTFNRGPAAYDEWVGIGIGGPESDISSYSTLVVWLSADVSRRVRVRLSSPAYDAEFGGILSEFGVDYNVGPSPRVLSIPLRSLYYPDWAKATWGDGQGFAMTDAEALERVLRRFDGVVFGPSATVDVEGELSAPVETGHLRIDNVYFR